jgi:hypothetical protein
MNALIYYQIGIDIGFCSVTRADSFPDGNAIEEKVMKKIKITLHKDGTQKVEVLGATGEGCLEFTRELEKRLGNQEGERVLKPEFEQTETEVEREHEAGQ